jgi:argininosuccinate lyase
MILWNKNQDTNSLVESFTVGNDREMDLYLASYDVLGSMAHIKMLNAIGILSDEDLNVLLPELKKIYLQAQEGKFLIEEGVEDVHSQVEMLLTKTLGDAGKSIHSGRSRNDQVLVDIKLYLRDSIKTLVLASEEFFNLLIEQSNKYKNVLIPGYTHFQVAMPSSFGLWFGAYAESLADDLYLLQAAYKIANQNPLGSGAGYGSSFPLNRTMTTELLGFDSLNYNVVYAQMGRGKAEKIVAMAMASLASTLSKMAMDVCMFSNQNYGFMTFPKELTTGSSIMPHKKNPDVIELIRAKCNRIQALPNEIALITTNLPSGYHRDMQIIKEIIFPAQQELLACFQLAGLMMENAIINNDIINEEKYLYIFSVEEVNKLVLQGIPFRDAYLQIKEQIEDGKFQTDKMVKHTHEGSIGNLCNAEIVAKFKQVKSEFAFEKVEQAINKLLA